MSEAVIRKCSVKKEFLKILQNSQENICAKIFFIKAAGLRPETLSKKDTPAEVFSCELYEIFRNTYFYRRWLLPVAASIAFLTENQQIKWFHKSTSDVNSIEAQYIKIR